MRRSRFLFVPLIVAALPLPAAAGTWSLGPNIGLSVLSSQNNSQTVFAWPGNAIGFMPGLRVGYFQRNAPHEFFVDTGLTYESSNGSSTRVLQATGNVQFNLSRRSSSGAYAAAGLGFWSVSQGNGTTSSSATVPSIGAGLGIRRVLRHGHGALRGEMRLDHYFEDQNAGLEAFNAMYVKLGFDLWMR